MGKNIIAYIFSFVNYREKCFHKFSFIYQILLKSLLYNANKNARSIYEQKSYSKDFLGYCDVGFVRAFDVRAGLGIGILFIIHVVLNIPMIKGLLNAVQCANPKPEKMILLISDIALTVCMLIVIVTGALAVFKNYTDKDITNNQYLPDKNTVSTPPVILQPNPSVNESVPDNEQSTESTVIESVPDNNKISESSAESISESTETTSPPSLEEYLSKLTCTGCGKRCSLLRPRCGKGQMQAERAKEQYYSTEGLR